MSSIEQSFHIAPTHRVEQRVNRVVSKDTSIIGVLARYSSYVTERMKSDKQSAYPLIVRLAEMDSIAGFEIIGDNVDLLLDVVSNERVILKNHKIVKGLVAQSKQIAINHSIAPSDMRLQKIEAIEKKIGTISEKGYEALPFHQEFPQLSLQDQVMIGELDGVYKKLLRKRRLEAPPSRELTLEDETHQYLRMCVDKTRGKTTVIEPEYQLKWLSYIWKEKLIKQIKSIYHGEKITLINEDTIMIGDKKIDELDDFVFEDKETLMKHILEQISDEQVKDVFLGHLAIVESQNENKEHAKILLDQVTNPLIRWWVENLYKVLKNEEFTYNNPFVVKELISQLFRYDFISMTMTGMTGYSPEPVFLYKNSSDLKNSYLYYQLTLLLDPSAIVNFFNSIHTKPYQPYNMSDIHARIANKILHDNPEQFIEIMSGASYSSSEFSADTLVENVFDKELFAHLCEEDRSWARSGYDSSLLDKSLSDVSAENYLMYRDSGSLEGGDPRGEPHPVVRTNIPLGAFLTTRRLANINEYGTGETTPIIFDPSIKDKIGAQYTVSYIPRLKKGKISLAVSPNSVIQELCVDHAVQDIPLNNHYEITSDEVEISYSATKNSFPDMPLVSYAQEVALPEELRKVKLPYELEALVENMREQPFTHQLLMIQELRDKYFIYDLNNKRVALLKTGKTLRERLTIMRKRAGEIKKENSDNKTFESIRWAGVCSDITFVSATLLAKLNIPFYIDVGFLVNDPVVTTQEAHSQIIIPLADEEGKRHDLEFDPTNGIMRIGNVKITPEQLREIIPVDNPTQPASIDPKKTGQNEFFAHQSLRHLTLKQRKNYKEQELYTKIAAVGESLGGSSVLRQDEKWSPSVINRLDSVQQYFLSQIVKDVRTTHPDGVKDIITYALSYIRKRGGTISREELKQIISTDKNLSFLIE